MHGHRLTILLEKDLLKDDTSHLACLDEGVGYKVPLWTISRGPARAETTFLGCDRVDEDEALSRDFALYPAAQGLDVQVSKSHWGGRRRVPYSDGFA